MITHGMENAKDVVLDHAASVCQPRTEDFSLVVGVDHYPQFRSLNGAIRDARAFDEWLRSADGGGVSSANAELLLSTEVPATPLQHEIDDRLLKLMKTADAIGGGRRLYFYFSGHGAADSAHPPGSVALLLVKWSTNLARLALSSSEYSGNLSGASLFKEIVIFLDCCRSTAVGAAGLPPTITFQRQSPPCSTRTFIAYATETTRPAFENQVNGLWHGVFTRCLLTILRSSPNGISAETLKNRLECEVPEARAGQQAHVSNDLPQSAQFGKRGLLPQLHITFRNARGKVSLLNGSLLLVADHDPANGPWQLALPPGLYLLRDYTEEVTVIIGRETVKRVEF